MQQILSTVLIEVKDSDAKITGSDGENFASRRFLAAVDEAGAVCVSAKLLHDVVSALPDGQITFDVDGTMLVLKQAASEWRFPVLPTDQYPDTPEVKAKSQLTLKMSEFREAIAGVNFAVGDDTGRQVLTGVLMMYDGKVLTLVATDTHRLAVMKIEREGIGSETNAVVPERALRAIKNLPLGDDDNIVLQFDEQRICVDAGNAIVTGQLLAGTFPNWERVVPQEHTRTWVVDRSELYDNVKRAMIIARNSANRVRFKGDGEQVKIFVRSEDQGEAREQVAAVTKNGDLEIAFNGSFILDALNSFRGEGIRAEMTEASRPAVFSEVEEGKNHFCVIMPMALG